MGCTSCATDSGKPTGCKSNGNCSTGGCNKMNTHDWFIDMPIAFGVDEYKVHEVSFKQGVSKGFFRNDKNLQVTTGDFVVVHTPTGQDLGEITLSGELVRLQMRKKKNKEQDKDLGSIVRIATEADIKLMEEFRAKEKDTLIQARAMAKTLNLDMKVSDVQYQGDGRKAIFYYIADGRVDFRELIKVYAGNFRVKVEMKQIGSRQEAGIVGGIGSCGRELCCSTWLTDFKSVNTGAARYQNISINMQKLSGQCGRLKCCLNYELDTYVEASRLFPQQVDELETKAGKLKLQKTDILKGLLFYAYEGKWDKFYPFTITQVNQLKENAAKGVLIESVYEVIEEEVNEEKEAYEDLVGQISIDSLEKKSKKKKKKKPGNRSAADNNLKKEAAPNNESAKPQAQATSQNKPNENRNQQQRRNRPDNRNRNRNQNRDNKGEGDKKD
jgi:cell fate regulator YaaT (PSP1 superfamily)